MNCEFSEIQYAFGVLREITQALNPSKGWYAPVMPTPAKEKQSGYDCEITGPVRTLFFQFKVPRKLTRTYARHWSDFYGEYYEFKIWPDSLTPQHNKLVDLAVHDFRNAVFYCAPAFIKEDDFQNYYRSNTICINSMMINCRHLAKIAGTDQHVITYRLDPRKYYMHSDNYSENYGANYDELISMLQNTAPYDDLQTCLSALCRTFNIFCDESNSIQETLHMVSSELLIRYNTTLVLF